MADKFDAASSRHPVASELCAEAFSAAGSEAFGAASSGAAGFLTAEGSRTVEGSRAADGSSAAAGSSTASSPQNHPDDFDPTPVSAWQILLIFLRLGCTSFGGPVAHLAFFQSEFVDKRRWLSASAYADLVALCQFLPGPASSQVGMALGWQQAGWRGALAAWFGFTMPSALLLIAAALGLVQGAWVNHGAQLGLLLVTMAVVAQALWSMQRSLCKGWRERAIALVVAVCLLGLGGGLALQLLILALVAVLGGWWLQAGRVAALRDDKPALANQPVATASRLTRSRVTAKRVMLGCLGLLGALLLLTPCLVLQWPDSLLWQLTDKLLRAGSLGVGGGHVVLPWLHSEFVGSGMVSEQLLASGYGITQAMPGPLFSVAALLGAASSLAVSPSPLLAIAYGLWALCVMFLPAWLLVLAAMPYWQQLRRHAWLQNMLQAVNAAVVGLLFVAWLSLWPPTLALTVPFGQPPALMLASLAGIVLVAAWLLQRRLLPVWLLVVGFALGFSQVVSQI